MSQSISEIVKKITSEVNENIKEIANGELTVEIKETYANEVEYMYSEYEPEYYVRRYYANGGFGSSDNHVVEPSYDKNGMVLTLKNTALADWDNYGRPLDYYIEYGIYNWKKHPDKRPVYERTIEVLEDEEIIKKVLKRELEKKGFNVE